MYLSEPLPRLILWRNTIQLFHQYRRPSFIGPFKEIDFQYHIEPYLLTTEGGEEKEPDIIASGESGWLVLELTNNPSSKKPKLDSYKLLDPRNLTIYGLRSHERSCIPDIICSRLTSVDDGDYCQILVKDILSINKEENLLNFQLKNAMLKAKDADLTKLPEIPISLIPEMNKSPKEIRRGLIDIVMQLFEPNSLGKNIADIVDEGLERLSDKVGLREKHALQSSVKRELDILIENYLKEYLEYSGNIFRSTEKWRQHTKTMEFISIKISAWVQDKNTQIEDWV
jgi:hypothetical protein